MHDQGQREQAIAHYSQALTLDPTKVWAYLNRGSLWYANRDYDKAMADYNQALRIDPNHAAGYCHRGDLWHRLNQYDKALIDYHQAVAIDPKYAVVYNNLAAIQATCPDARYRDGKKAFHNARQAYMLDGGKSYGYVCTLAETYAENGDFQRAREWMEKAIAISASAQLASEKNAAEMRSALELFKKGKPYREEPGSW